MDNANQFKKAENFLMKKFPDLAGDTQSKFSGQKLVIRDATEVIRKEVIGGNTADILEPGQVRETGVSTFNGNRFPKGRNLVVTDIRVAYAQNAASDKTKELDYSNLESDAPAGLKGANLIVEQDGNEVIKVPVMEVLAPAKDSASGFHALSSFAFLKEEVEIDIKIEFPKGVALHDTEKSYVEVALKGLATFSKK